MRRAAFVVLAFAVFAVAPVVGVAIVALAGCEAGAASHATTASSDAAAGDLAPPDRRAEVMSGYSDWIDVGAALGPPLAFVLADRLGLFPSYACTAVLLIAVAGWFVAASRRPSLLTPGL